MKKTYAKPKAEVVSFDYRESVVASGATPETAVKCSNPCGGGGEGGFTPQPRPQWPHWPHWPAFIGFWGCRH